MIIYTKLYSNETGKLCGAVREDGMKQRQWQVEVQM